MAPKDPVMEGVRHVISASSSVGSLALALDKVQRENLVPDRVIKDVKKKKKQIFWFPESDVKANASP
nr:hypothetical protein BaRGS_003760 [Batillaria attramentaria]